MNKERLVFEVAEGVTTLGEGELMSLGFTPEDGRELVSWAVKLVCPSPSYLIRRAFDLKKERLVFGITDGVSTPEEVTPWEGGAHVSGDEIFSFIQI